MYFSFCLKKEIWFGEIIVRKEVWTDFRAGMPKIFQDQKKCQIQLDAMYLYYLNNAKERGVICV